MGLLEGKVAIITGSGRGIGKGIAQMFVKEGAKVTINDIDKDVCEATAAEIGESALACPADVTNKEQVGKMVADTVAKFGKVDILINCAGITRDALIHKMDDKLLRFIIDVNLKGTHVCTQAVLPEFLKDGRNDDFKKIVNFASTTGVSGNIGQANYAIAKAGVIGYTKSVAREYAMYRVNCNAVAPGFVETRMTQEKKPGDKMGIPKAIRDLAISAIPFARKDAEGISRGGLPEHVAKVVLFFASGMGDWISGQLLTVDGATFI